MSQDYILGVFVVVYVGMIFGGLPGLALDRTAVALLGAIALLAGGALDARSAWAAVDMPTMSLLFGLMLVSAQLRLSGFYTYLARRMAAAQSTASGFLLIIMLGSALLSAILVNDIVVLALTPVLVEGCIKRGLNPVPYLLGLACAANIGSAATLIGNPQNMLIGQVGSLSFAAFALDCLPPVLAGLLAAWGIIVYLSRGDWELVRQSITVPVQEFQAWPTLKGGLLLLIVLFGFLFTSIPREVLALCAGGVVLISRRFPSRTLFALVDWSLLILFLGLFVVNHSLLSSGLLERMFLVLKASGLDLAQPATMFAVSAVLSNIISNVPAVMLLLPVCPGPEAKLLLALSSTLAGNLFLLGSIANLIVAEQAARYGIFLTWRKHLRIGLPVTLVTFALAAAWLWLRWDNLFVAASG